jgi:hypothetical protein
MLGGTPRVCLRYPLGTPLTSFVHSFLYLLLLLRDCPRVVLGPRPNIFMFYSQRVTLPKSLPLLASCVDRREPLLGARYSRVGALLIPRRSTACLSRTGAFLERLGGSCTCRPDTAELIKDNATTAQRLSSTPGMLRVRSDPATNLRSC